MRSPEVRRPKIKIQRNTGTTGTGRIDVAMAARWVEVVYETGLGYFKHDPVQHARGGFLCVVILPDPVDLQEPFYSQNTL